jgi:hypothetical protein
MGPMSLCCLRTGQYVSLMGEPTRDIVVLVKREITFKVKPSDRLRSCRGDFAQPNPVNAEWPIVALVVSILKGKTSLAERPEPKG